VTRAAKLYSFVLAALLLAPVAYVMLAQAAQITA
jgi:multisubunit Na+/H+ antiporter MnhG subunit